MNKQLIKELRAVKKAILAEPKKFDMRWFMSSPQAEMFSDEVRSLLGKGVDCGTTACIYGWHYTLFERNKGNKLPELISDKQFAVLCHDKRWPEPFKSRYQKAKTHRTRAKIAAERIEHFIKTGGEE